MHSYLSSQQLIGLFIFFLQAAADDYLEGLPEDSGKVIHSPKNQVSLFLLSRKKLTSPKNNSTLLLFWGVAFVVSAIFVLNWGHERHIRQFGSFEHKSQSIGREEGFVRRRRVGAWFWGFLQKNPFPNNLAVSRLFFFC